MRKILHTILTCLLFFLQKLSTCCSFYENKVGMFSENILWQTFPYKICLEQKKFWLPALACLLHMTWSRRSSSQIHGHIHFDKHGSNFSSNQVKAWKILGCRLTRVLLFAVTHSMSEFFRLYLCHCLSDVHRNSIFNLNLLLTMVKLRGVICSFLQIHLG